MANQNRPILPLRRWREVQLVFLRYGFGFIFNQQDLREARAGMRKRLHLKAADVENNSVPRRVRRMLEELGPTYIKLGQILSNRSDLLPEDWIGELSLLQDDVPPFAYAQVVETINKEFGKPLETLFSEFDPEPMAAASLGQVHRARLITGERVVVKVQRPGIKPQVQADIEILHQIARLIEAHTDWGKRIGMVAVVEEFGRTLDEEMDYYNEANNARRLRQNMMLMGRVNVPRIFWELTTTSVLTMESIQGIKIDQLAELDAAEIDRVELSDVLLRALFKQILIDGFYHADLHPGNLLVEPETQTLVFIDLGMMGSLRTRQREQLTGVVQAILRRDSDEVTRLLLEIGTPFEQVDTAALSREIDRLINRFVDAPLDKISIADLFSAILTTVFRHGIRLPSEFSLAIKSIIQCEGVARVLNPKLAIVDILRTVYQEVSWEQINPQKLFESVYDTLREVNRLMKEIPRAAEGLLHSAADGTLKVGVDIPEFSHMTHPLTVISNRMTAGLIVAGTTIGSAIAMGVSPKESWSFIPVLGVIGFIASLVVGGALVWSVFIDLWKNRKNKS